MLERSLEIIIRLCPEQIFGPGWELRAQQLGLSSGRIDLLFSDEAGRLNVVEVKKGRANQSALDQVLRYTNDLMQVQETNNIIPWVVAHDISPSVRKAAAGMSVRCLALPLSRCQELMQANSIDENILLGPRRDDRVLYGGGPKRGLRNPVENDDALAEMPNELADTMLDLASRPNIDLASGGMQTVIHYKGVKLGGVNRKHRGGVSYIATGVVLTPMTEERLSELQFTRMTKTQAGQSHEHVWWETPWTNVIGFGGAIDFACQIVDNALRLGRTE